MGRGTIQSAKGDALYSVELDEGAEIVEARQAAIDEEMADVDDKLSDLQDAYDDAVAATADALSNVNAAIAALQAATPDGFAAARNAVKAASAAYAQAKLDERIAQVDLDAQKRRKKELEDERRKLSSVDASRVTDLWCADFTPDGEGEVAIIEVPGGEPQHQLIAPTCRAPTDDDGWVIARELQTPEQVFYNAAILPGVQKHKPTYRFGTLSNLNREENTCSIALEAATSTAQSLDVNLESSFDDVPIEYGECDHRAFFDDDVVLVAFNNSWESPKVIGFKKEPRSCNLLTPNGYIFLTVYLGAVEEAQVYGTMPKKFAEEIAENPADYTFTINGNQATWQGWGFQYTSGSGYGAPLFQWDISLGESSCGTASWFMHTGFLGLQNEIKLTHKDKGILFDFTLKMYGIDVSTWPGSLPYLMCDIGSPAPPPASKPPPQPWVIQGVGVDVLKSHADWLVLEAPS